MKTSSFLKRAERLKAGHRLVDGVSLFCSRRLFPRVKTEMGRLRRPVFCGAGSVAILLICLAGSGRGAELTQPIADAGPYSFAPNQLAAAEWYRPQGAAINGHVAGSFTETDLWPRLFDFLRRTDSSLGINAAEIGHLTSDQLLAFRTAGVPISTEMPAWTQCFSGRSLGDLEFLGDPVEGKNLFETIFHISTATGRFDPAGRGWFVTKDGQDYAPDEIVLDHRIPALLPSFNAEILLAGDGGLTWEARKAKARVDPCPQADAFHAEDDRLTGLIRDYLDYAEVMTRRFANRPAFSFHWNVHPGWEWADEQCLDALHVSHPNPASFERAFRFLEAPCHRDTAILSRLLDVLCNSGACPRAVFMDMELQYRTDYALDVLRRNKDVLRKHGVAFGVDLADECNEQLGCQQISPASGQMKLEQESISDDKSINLLDQRSLSQKFEFLLANGIIDQSTHVRFESWSARPIEKEGQIDETIQGSYANTALRIVCRVIAPLGWLQPATKIAACKS